MAVVVASQLSPRAQASTIVISGATLIDGTGAPPIRDASLVIRNGRVAEVLKGGAKAPADAQIIDAKGKTVIPGLIDGHVHYRPWMGELCLASGVTTIVDLGNADEWVKALIEARELGKIRMPRMFASGSRLGAREDVRRKKLIQPVAAHKPHFVFVDVEKGKEMIREKKKNGLHIIKVDETWTKEDLKQLVDLAHSLDMPIVGHATDPRDSALAGQDAIMHMYGLTVGVADPAKVDALYRQELADVYSPLDPGRYRDLITLLIKEDVALNIQLARDFALKRQREYMAQDQQLLSRPQLQYVPMGVRVNTFRTHQKALGRSHEELESWEKIKRFVREFVAAGGKMIAGADTVAFSLPGYGLWRELDGLAEAGVEPMKIILSATKNVADLYRLKEVGTLEPGKLADLLILNGDPLADLRNLEKIDTVMIGGEVVDRAFHAEYHNVFERPYAEDTGPGLPPVLREISPRLSVEGSGPLDLTVTGIRFDEFTSVVFDGVAVSTTLVTPRELKARIPADLLKRAGTFRVTLDDPRFLGAPSDYYGFIVKYRR